MTIDQIVAFIRDAGVIGLLAVAIVGGMRRWYVWRWYVDELHLRIDKLERQLERATRAAESGTVAADRATKLAERRTEVPDV